MQLNIYPLKRQFTKVFYLTLFMFSMIGIVLSDNTILMYIFWELTSVSSFLLISYWYNNGDSQFGAISIIYDYSIWWIGVISWFYYAVYHDRNE